MKFLGEKFSTRDLTLIGITSALCIVLGVIVRGLVGLVVGKVPGLENFILGTAQGIILTIGILKVNRQYFLTMVGLCMGAIYGFVFPGHPFLFVTFFLSGIIGDLAGKFTHLSYKAPVSVIFFRVSAGVLGILLAAWIGFSDTKLVWSLMIINNVAAGIGAGLGAYFGIRFFKDIQKTGFMGFNKDAVKQL